MRAAILRQGRMVVDDVPDPRPGPGQVLVETIACGICGSDLHTVDHAAPMVTAAREAGVDALAFDPDRDLVMGHELAVRAIELGPGVEGVPLDQPMAAMPILTTPTGRVTPGYENDYPGGYSERFLLDPSALVPVPNGLPGHLAALTEPLAVGLHAVNQSSASPGRPALVIGAGPVGLSVIAALAGAGVEPIVATDLSPARRGLARAMGAHVVVDPGEAPDRASGFALAVEAVAEASPSGPGSGSRAPVVFEAVGVPGMIELAMSGAPTGSELVVVGVCMEDDRFRPSMGIFKHLTIRFVLGWSGEEFRASLRAMADGRIDPEALVTDQIGLDEVPDAFARLAHPDDQVKILVRPNGT
jgi:threonine dehydrogenase-like Zn-dependent dehydrogenase